MYKLSLFAISWLLIALAPTTPVSAAEAAAAPAVVPLQAPRSRAFDMQHVALDLQFDWKKRQAYGVAALTLTPLKRTQTLKLDAGMLKIESIQLTNGSALAFDYDGGDRDEGLVIPLDREYEHGEALTLNIAYRTTWINDTDPNNLWGSNGRGLRFFSPSDSEPRERRQIWSSGDPKSSRYWFPCFDAPNDRFTSEFSATVATPLSVIAIGELVATRNEANGMRRYHWRLDTPHSNDQVGFVVGEYVDVPIRHGDSILHNFSYPDEVDAVKASIERLPDMVDYFSTLTGVAFPNKSYSQVFVQELPWGMALPTLAIQSENMIDDARTHADYLYLWDGLEAESLARQWFGHHLQIRDWSESWLSQGFSRHLDELYAEHKNGRVEFLLWYLSFDHATYLADWNSSIRFPVVTQRYDDAVAFAGGNYPKLRGALLLNMLRQHLGDAQWRRALKHYTQKHAGQIVATADLRDAIEDSTGEAMDWFFDQWVYAMGHPVFEVVESYDRTKQELMLTVKQTQQPDPAIAYPQTQYFQGYVDIEIDARIERVWLQAQAQNEFRFADVKAPRWINFDYESTWIKELKYPKSDTQLLALASESSDALARSAAFGELVTRARAAKADPQLKAKVETLLGTVILGDDYWRLRMQATTQLGALLASAQNGAAAIMGDGSRALLLKTIVERSAWCRAAAILTLAKTRDPQYADLYLSYFYDPSDRVINAAAIALGQSGNPKAFDALIKLPNKPSWKNQSLISALYGLTALKDPRAVDLAVKAIRDRPAGARWTLATPVWDFRLAAADTLAAINQGGKAYPIVQKRLREAMRVGDISDIFNNLMLIVALADRRGLQEFAPLRKQFAGDDNALAAINGHEQQLIEKLK